MADKTVVAMRSSNDMAVRIVSKSARTADDGSSIEIVAGGGRYAFVLEQC